MIIELATVKDAEQILELQKLAYKGEADIYNDYSIAPLNQSLEGLRDDLKGQAVFKVSIGEKTIGSVRAYVNQDTCYVGRLIVHPNFQNRGIGTQLMNEVENHFKSVKRFELFTGHKSGKNLYLYQKLGYKIFKSETVTGDLMFLYMEKTV